MPSLETFKPSRNQSPAAVVLWSVDWVGGSGSTIVGVQLESYSLLRCSYGGARC